MGRSPSEGKSLITKEYFRKHKEPLKGQLNLFIEDELELRRKVKRERREER